MISRLPDELYIEIFKWSGVNPMKFRVSKYFQRIIFDLYPFTRKLAVKVCKMIIHFNKYDLLKTFKWFRNYPNEHNGCSFYPVIYASYLGNADMVKVLMSDPRFDPSTGDNCAIRYASNNGCVEVVKILLADPRCDPSVQDNYAIISASTNGHTEIVKVLSKDSRVYNTIDVSQFIKN